MMMTKNQELHTASSQSLDRMLWITGILLLLVMVGFGVFYYRDRYVHADERLVDRQIRHMEELVRQDPADVEARVAVAKLYLGNGIYDKAIQQADEALELSPTHQMALYIRGKANELSGNVDQAIQDYEQIVTLNEDNEFAHINQRLNAVYYDLGQLYRNQGEDDKAVEALQQALGVDRTDADAYYVLGLVYQRQGKHDDALEQFQSALRFVPDFMEVYQAMQTSYEAQGRTAEVAYATGMIAFSQADYEQAVQQIELAVQQAPDFDLAYLGLGLTYEKLGQIEKAVDALHRYMKDNPDSVVVQHALGRLNAATSQ